MSKVFLFWIFGSTIQLGMYRESEVGVIQLTFLLSKQNALQICFNLTIINIEICPLWKIWKITNGDNWWSNLWRYGHDKWLFTSLHCYIFSCSFVRLTSVTLRSLLWKIQISSDTIIFGSRGVECIWSIEDFFRSRCCRQRWWCRFQFISTYHNASAVIYESGIKIQF